MITELAVRFLIGGLVVSAFAALGEMVRPQSFAGLDQRAAASNQRSASVPNRSVAES